MLSLEACLVIISLSLICAENKKANHQNKDDCKKEIVPVIFKVNINS